jgi:uncharacterized protein (TIRG00374 family)
MRALKFVLAFALIAWLIQKGNLALPQLERLWRGDIVAELLLLAGINLVLANWRWMVLLKARHFPSNPFSTFRLTLIGLFFSYALPGSVGGDFIKAYYVAQDHFDRKVEAVMTVFVDRIIGLYCMLAMALFSMVLDRSLILADPSLRALAALTFGSFLALTMFFGIVGARPPKIKEWLGRLPLGPTLAKIYDAFELYSSTPWALVNAFLLSLASQIVAVFFIFAVGWFLDSPIPINTYLFAVPIGFIVSAIPISPAGIGVGQLAFAFLFHIHSRTDSPIGQVAVTAYQVAFLIWGLGGAVFYLLRKKPMTAITQV